MAILDDIFGRLQQIEFSSDITEVMRENESTRKALLSLQQELDAALAIQDQLRAELTLSRKQFEDTSGALRTAMAATDEAEGRVAAAAEKQEEMAREAKQLGRQLTELEEENLGLRSRIRLLTEAAEAKDKQIKQLEREVAAKVTIAIKV